jgi:hypothetical protein
MMVQAGEAALLLPVFDVMPAKAGIQYAAS